MRKNQKNEGAKNAVMGGFLRGFFLQERLQVWDIFFVAARKRETEIKKNAPPYPRRAFKWTIKTLMSAGETPEMREACPTVMGENSRSFCAASMRSPRMAE